MSTDAPPTIWRMPTARWMVPAAVLFALVVRLVVGVHTIDDAFITFRYSQHIAASQGFTYNPPQHVLGTSTPLFTLLLAVPAWFGLDLPVAAFVVSLIADAVSLSLVAAIVVALGYPLAALLSIVALALAPSVLMFSVSGMETSLYMALVLAVVWALQRERWRSAAVIGGCAWLCRPDGVLIAAAVIGSALWWSRRRVVELCLLVAVVMGPWLIFATWYFGSPIPTSVRAKAELAATALAGFRVAKGFFLSERDLLLSVMAIIGAVRMWRVGAPAARAWIAWSAVYLVLFASSAAFDGYQWYFTPLMPLYYAAVAIAIEALLRRLGAASAAPVRRAIAAAGPATAIVLFLTVGIVAANAHRHAMAAGQSIREGLYRSIARSLAASDGRCAIAAQEIGALGFYYPGPIVDLVGIATPEAIGRRRGDVLRESTACWLVTYDNNLFLLDPGIFTDGWFQRDFVLIDRTPVSPVRSLVTYRRRRDAPAR